MDALSRIAAGRYGVVTIGEAEKCGVTRAQVRTLIRQGQWMRPRSGILVSSSAAASWMQQCAIASMASRGILSCRTAGFIHGLDGISDPPIEVTIPSSQNRPAGPWVIHRADNLVAADTVKVKGLHVTSLARTLVDLGSVAKDDVVEQALDDAYRLGLTPKKLFSTLQRYQPGSVGAASLRRVLARPDRAGPLPGSKFERILQRAIRDAGLPQPQRQCPVIDASGRIVAYIDLGWPEIWLGVEADSARWHDGMRNGRRDDLRDQLLMSLGWELFYVGWHAATHPDQFTQRLAETYEIRMQRARIEGFYQFQSGRGH